MISRLHHSLVLSLLLLLSVPVSAATVSTDTVCPPAEGKSGKSFIKKFIDYFGNANKGKDTKGMDFSLIGGPYYNTDMGLGIGIVASGLYRTADTDSILPPSNASLFGKISTKGFASIGIRGTHIAPEDTYRITYIAEFLADPSDYWGIGYEMANNDANESNMKRTGVKINGAFLFHLGSNIYAGPKVMFDYIHAFKIERPDLLMGMRTSLLNTGIGVTLSYDSRDVLTNPHRGIYASVSQSFRPRFMGNKYAFSTTELQLDGYRPLWNGATLAGDLRATFNIGNPSWYMMAQVGGSYFMRGYYEGRYRDKNMMAAQVELRQHLWRRIGIVAWGGTATVFSKFSQVQMRRMLPNAGVGFRWEFKKDVNVRFDIGFGKSGQNGFMFNINEAF